MEAVANLDLWQVIAAALIVVAGSSAASALISSLFENSRVKSKAQRDARSAALTSIGNAYATYLTIGNTKKAGADDDARVAESGAIMLSETAKVGKKLHLADAEKFRTLGERFASKDEDTSVAALRQAFLNLINDMSDGIKK